MTVWICDWTHWQGKPLPAEGVADEGYGMVKLKAGGVSQGSRYYEDPMFMRSAVALLNEPRLLPAAFWYLMPARARAQAGLFADLLDLVDIESWAAFLDVEQPGVNWRDVHNFSLAWSAITGGRKLVLYTRKQVWQQIGAPIGLGADTFSVLEEAHWVPESVRKDPSKPYASQQAKAIDPSWWDVNYGGWEKATMLQFTDNALVQGVRTTASIFRGTKSELLTLLVG